MYHTGQPEPCRCSSKSALGCPLDGISESLRQSHQRSKVRGPPLWRARAQYASIWPPRVMFNHHWHITVIAHCLRSKLCSRSSHQLSDCWMRWQITHFLALSFLIFLCNYTLFRVISFFQSMLCMAV